jgi:hypothetical protein
MTIELSVNSLVRYALTELRTRLEYDIENRVPDEPALHIDANIGELLYEFDLEGGLWSYVVVNKLASGHVIVVNAGRDTGNTYDAKPWARPAYAELRKTIKEAVEDAIDRRRKEDDKLDALKAMLARNDWEALKKWR